MDCHSSRYKRPHAIFSKIAWSRPEYAREDRLPFIPLQKECEQLIDASRNLGQACYLRLLYETAMRCGEASSLRREDFDFELHTVRVLPEKNSWPRELRISERLCSMLRTLQAKEKPLPSPEAARHYLDNTRRTLAETQNNPRFDEPKVFFMHIGGHGDPEKLATGVKGVWDAIKKVRTENPKPASGFGGMTPQDGKIDAAPLEKILGHKSIQNTLRYIQLVTNDEPSAWIVKAASNVDEAKGLLEQGFEYVTDMESVKLFRRRAQTAASRPLHT